MMFLPNGYTVQRQLEDYIGARARARLPARHDPCIGAVNLYRDLRHWDSHYREHVPRHGDGGEEGPVLHDKLPPPRDLPASPTATASCHHGSARSPTTSTMSPPGTLKGIQAQPSLCQNDARTCSHAGQIKTRVADVS